MTKVSILLISSILILIVPVVPMDLPPIQLCLLQWNEYEILVRYMLDHDYVDVQFLIIDEFMLEEAIKIRSDFRYASKATINLERGLIAFRYLLDVHDLNTKY